MKYYIVNLLAFISISVSAQKITYRFSAPNAIHHEAEITLIAEKLPLKTAVFRMSRSSPGRYATHEFGKNVYNVKAFANTGKPLAIQKTEGDVYTVTNHKGFVKVTYTLYANYADGTYSDIDVTGYHINMPATFMWVKGMENAPINISFSLPDKTWKIATQLKQQAGNSFFAPNLQYFMDSPVITGDLFIREWQVNNPGGKQYTMRLALRADATEGLVDTFTNNLKKIVAQAKEVYGEYPAYDYGTYTFLATINPYVYDDGMEHRNSTMITTRKVFDGTNDLLGVFSHEFFHCWNVKRIRPRSLQPFNFEKSNMSEALWLAEGFTQYYGNLLQIRSKVIPEEEFLNGLARLINAKSNTPGGIFYTPQENSRNAVFTDAGVSIDRTNYPNMYTSYYSIGGAIALALDFELRIKYAKSLDTYMRQLWIQFGKKEIPYTIQGLQDALATVTDATFAKNFFAKYIDGTQPYDYKSALEKAHLSVEKVNTLIPWIGNVQMATVAAGIWVPGNTIRNTPLYLTGVDAGDVLAELGGEKLKEVKDIENILVRHKPGESLPLTYFHRGKMIKTMIQLQENPGIKVVESRIGLTDEHQIFSSAWLEDKTIKE